MQDDNERKTAQLGAVYITPTMLAEVKEFAWANKLSKSELVRRALKDYIRTAADNRVRNR